MAKRQRRSPDDQGRPGETFGLHRGVLVGGLPGLDEAAQRVGHLIGGNSMEAWPITRHHQHRIERTGEASPRSGVGFRRQSVARKLQATVQ
ncbi:hypothetical protein J113_22645 [Mycobacterium tuberculosis CAS/NITR204]|uniref:Uncharacterized protein n=1 Tax=Mycobacterium tuberculosis CAS/NITR204 TaxID=1310114 RepID=R4MMH1_MYCTX|nr:hypothetical protein J113_22645 [Mycobacterium tuberculosis CAS/NITR204]